MLWEMQKVFDLSRRMNTWKSNVNAFNFSSGTKNVMDQPKKEKNQKYICFGCDKEKEITGDITPEETFCKCGDQFMKDWEYRTLKAKPKKSPILTEGEILEKVGFNIKTMA